MCICFAGNPSNVTIFGQSVGGAFVCLHLLSPQSRGLFHAAISESATNCDIGVEPTSLATSHNLTRYFMAAVGCNQTTSTDRLACLRSVPADVILAVSVLLGAPTQWIPSLNGYDFPNPLLAFSTGDFAHVPYLVGSNLLEYALLYALTPELNYSSLASYTSFLDTYSDGDAAVESAFNVSNFGGSVLAAALHYQTLSNFSCSAGRMAGYWAQQGLPIYLYTFMHTPQLGAYDVVLPAPFHASELPFLFGNVPSIYNIIQALTPDEMALRDAMRRYWVSFASTGNPNNVDNTDWPMYTANSDLALAINLTQSSTPWLSAYPNCALLNQVQPQNYASVSGTFTTTCTGDVCSSQLLTQGSGSALGDPVFTSFHGVRYQVHGLSGQVYVVLSDPQLLINARFTFLSTGECPPAAVSTLCFSHPGSYFGSLALRSRGGSRLLLQPGAASEGFSSIELDGAAVLHLGTPRHSSSQSSRVRSKDGGIHITVLDAWRVDIEAGNYRLRVDSSDRFVNIAAITVNDWSSMVRELKPHGLLGQTWRVPDNTAAHKQTPKEGTVDDYVEVDNDLFGYNTMYNRFASE